MRFVKIIGIVAVRLFGMAGQLVAAQSSSEIVPCPGVIISGLDEVEGETVECGIVTVPANYDNPDGAQIELMYGILKAQTLSPAADPVIYLHGGPGGAELGELTLELKERFASLRQRRDVVVFDQRGTGFSPGEIDCAETFAANFDAAQEAAAKNTEDVGFDVAKAANRILVNDCIQALSASDIDLTQYNTVNNARDVASLARALGHDSFNVYGLSYGTKLGTEVIRQNPPGLRAVILDSVITPELKFYERLPEANDVSFSNIYNMCVADKACADAYPDLVERLNALFEQLGPAGAFGRKSTVLNTF
jgi:pimeloyl-ACP methyl ester carboxylesterase